MKSSGYLETGWQKLIATHFLLLVCGTEEILLTILEGVHKPGNGNKSGFKHQVKPQQMIDYCEMEGKYLCDANAECGGLGNANLLPE